MHSIPASGFDFESASIFEGWGGREAAVSSPLILSTPRRIVQPPSPVSSQTVFKTTLKAFNSFHFSSSVLAKPTPAPMSPLFGEILRKPIAKRKRRRQKTCNCKNSGCLKLYCECFKDGGMCGSHCKCKACKNKTDSEERDAALAAKGVVKGTADK